MNTYAHTLLQFPLTIVIFDVHNRRTKDLQRPWEAFQRDSKSAFHLCSMFSMLILSAMISVSEFQTTKQKYEHELAEDAFTDRNFKFGWYGQMYAGCIEPWQGFGSALIHGSACVYTRIHGKNAWKRHLFQQLFQRPRAPSLRMGRSEC